MEFFIKQKLFNVWQDKYTIKDINENDVFEVKTDVKALKRLTIYDMAGNPLLKLKKRYWRFFMPRWDILDADGKLLYIVKRKFVPFVPRYKIISKIEPNSGEKYSITGSIWGFSFSILDKDKKVVATISKKIVSWGDVYSIIVDEPNDVMLSIGSTLIFDLIHHKNRSSLNNNLKTGTSMVGDVFKLFK